MPRRIPPFLQRRDSAQTEDAVYPLGLFLDSAAAQPVLSPEDEQDIARTHATATDTRKELPLGPPGTLSFLVLTLRSDKRAAFLKEWIPGLRDTLTAVSVALQRIFTALRAREIAKQLCPLLRHRARGLLRPVPLSRRFLYRMA